jgi:hypothetical protein
MKSRTMIDVITLVLLVVAISAGAGVKARDVLWHKDIKVKYAVTLKGNEGDFAGLLVEESRRTMVFEHCVTVPQSTEQSPQPILGRVYIDRANIAYRQELPNDPV